MDVGFGTRKVRGLYRVGSLKTAACKLGKYEIDVVAIHEVRRNKGGTQTPNDYEFLRRNGNANYH
jgi:hypothetical protein